MELNEYRQTSDYLEAIKLIFEFTDDVLGRDIFALNNKDLSEMKLTMKNNEKKRYFGDIKDPDMYRITQAIYIVVWGHIYNLSFDNMGSWGQQEQKPFRGDTMNSFRSVYGEKRKVFEHYKLHEDDNLNKMLDDFQKIYHSIGNFIVIPNRNDVNSKRGNYCTMQDFFDSFLGAIYQYQNLDEKTEYYEFCEILKPVLDINEEYKNISFDIFTKEFYLENYLKEGKPFNVFGIDYALRKKEYKCRERGLRAKNGFFSEAEYMRLATQYYMVSQKIISYRGKKICEKIKEALDLYKVL